MNDSSQGNHPLKIGVVGPCAAGKSTLIAGLKQAGYNAVHIAQEHSYVPDMWQRITRPDVLIYLDVTYPVAVERRQMNWAEADYNQQVYRLRHALQHAQIHIKTDDLGPAEVLDRVLAYLDQQIL